MANDLPWFKVYAAETLSDENFQGWDQTERGAWFTLILVCWREGSIPSDQTSLAKLLHLDGSVMRQAWSAIGSRFVEHPDHPGRLTSPRLEKEREAARLLHNAKVGAGKKGAKSRWDKIKRRHGRPIALPKQTDSRSVANDSDQIRAEQGSTDSSSHARNRSTRGGHEGEKGLGVLGSQLVRRVEEGLGHGLVPARNGVAESLEADIAAWGGVDAALAFIASTCRNRNTEPQSVAWLAKVLGPARGEGRT